MCGIAGKLDFGGAVDVEVVVRMCNAMKHRGPDSRGFMSAPGIALGMQRLAIIDVQGGDQPIFNEDRTVAVVMNGEIYNFQELRDELVAKGHTFTSHSDTEVLVHLYEDCGDRLVERLRGMFAFAIWDTKRQALLLGRDRVGKKPLFWSRRGSTFWFASELMALLQDPAIDRGPEPVALANYLTYQYIPAPSCAFANIHKLEPATVVTIDAAGERKRRYWALDYTRKLEDIPRPEIEERLRQHLWEATRVRLISEVPLGAFLSGGIDSSAVVAAMAEQMASPVKTFSIGFGDVDFDERRFARMVAERYGTEHHEFTVEPEAISIMPRLARHYGEPFADPSAIPSFYLAELTSRHVTVALNGDGGDESFAGYNRYAANLAATQFGRLPAALRKAAPQLLAMLGPGTRTHSLRARLQRRASVVAMDPLERYAYGMAAFPKTVQEWALADAYRHCLGGWHPDTLIAQPWKASKATDMIDRMLDVDIQTYLPGDLLVKMDIATMAFSVEGRSPFLDHHLMEFAASIRTTEKYGPGGGKAILKSALRGIVPDEILDRRKMGFGVPLSRWFREELRDVPGEVLLDSGARTTDYVKRSAISRMISEHQSRTADHSLRLWVLLQLEHWFRDVVDSPLLQPGELAEREHIMVTAGADGLA